MFVIMAKKSKLAARVHRLRWQAHGMLHALFSMRIILLALTAVALWSSGGFLRDSFCSSSAAADPQQQAAAGGHIGILYTADTGPGRQLQQGADVYSDVPGHFGPPYFFPRLIHQTVEDRSTMSCQVRESIQTWIDMNPGYTHKLYDANDRVKFVKQYYPELLDLFLSLPTNVERADTWRYLALHKLGGVYADSDVRCMQPISTWNAEHGHDAALLAGIAKRTFNGITQEFNQFVMAAMPGHPVMASMPLIIAGNLAASFLRGRQVHKSGIFHDLGVLSRTGPGAYTWALQHYAKRVGGHWPLNSTRADELGGIRFGTVRAMPKFVMGMGWETIDFNMTCLEVKQKVRPEAYICHQFFGTWKKQPEISTNLTYTNCAGNLVYNEYSTTRIASIGTGNRAVSLDSSSSTTSDRGIGSIAK